MQKKWIATLKDPQIGENGSQVIRLWAKDYRQFTEEGFQALAVQREKDWFDFILTLDSTLTVKQREFFIGKIGYWHDQLVKFNTL